MFWSLVRVVRAVFRSDVGTAFDEVCAVVLDKNGVPVPGFVGQTVVGDTNNFCSSPQGSFNCRFE